MTVCKVHPPPPCDCPLAGFCERHQRTKGPRMHELCQTDAKYRAKWDVDAKKPEVKERAKRTRKQQPTVDSLACIHRGEQLGIVENCGCGYGNSVPIFGCDHPSINQRVVLRKVGRRPHTKEYQNYPVCQGCELRTRPAVNPAEDQLQSQAMDAAQ